MINYQIKEELESIDSSKFFTIVRNKKLNSWRFIINSKYSINKYMLFYYKRNLRLYKINKATELMQKALYE